MHQIRKSITLPFSQTFPRHRTELTILYFYRRNLQGTVSYFLDYRALHLIFSSGRTTIRAFYHVFSEEKPIVHCIMYSPLKGHPRGHFVIFLSIGHCISFSPPEGHPLGHFIMLPQIQEKPIGHCIMYYPLEGHSRGHVLMFSCTQCHPSEHFIIFFPIEGQLLGLYHIFSTVG